MTDYMLDNAWRQARERLAALEAWLDPGTTRHLEALGVGAGWRCLEVGAGGGSVAAWLGARVGPSGYVLATDIDTRFLDALAAPNVEVRQHDIVTEALPEGAFDLVHARAVLEHLPQHERALGRMAAALKPGGWLLVEDVDFASFVPGVGGRRRRRRPLPHVLGGGRAGRRRPGLGRRLRAAALRRGPRPGAGRPRRGRPGGGGPRGDTDRAGVALDRRTGAGGDRRDRRGVGAGDGALPGPAGEPRLRVADASDGGRVGTPANRVIAAVAAAMKSVARTICHARRHTWVTHAAARRAGNGCARQVTKEAVNGPRGPCRRPPLLPTDAPHSVARHDHVGAFLSIKGG